MGAGFIEEVTESVGNRAAPVIKNIIFQALQREKTTSVLLVGGISFIAIIVFGYLIARITLSPARNALSSQKRFIGNIAHELRTPLSIIKTNTEVALLDEVLADEFKNMLRSNVEELDRISDIINNLLSLNTFVRPERIEFRNVDLGEIVDRVVGKLSPLVKGKGLELRTRKSEFRTVWGNGAALEQIVMNILKNSINYTPVNGQVTLTLEPDYRGHIELVVQDSGIGITRKDLFRIFEPFYRAEQSRTRSLGGSGLGLAIVNELVKLHHGKIIIKSALKRGTTVTVSLPCGSTAPKETGLKEQPVKEEGEIAIDFSEETV